MLIPDGEVVASCWRGIPTRSLRRLWWMYPNTDRRVGLAHDVTHPILETRSPRYKLISAKKERKKHGTGFGALAIELSTSGFLNSRICARPPRSST